MACSKGIHHILKVKEEAEKGIVGGGGKVMQGIQSTMEDLLLRSDGTGAFARREA